ncbi:MAG: DNA primase [Chloroflexi bacterium]|nr:MAG: DNA primase [Chloroflexota bacterium]
MSVTEEIKTRLDIVSYIQQYVPIKKAGRYYKACCPFHNEKTPSFVVNPDTQSWRCFGACAEGGDIFSFAQKYHGWDFREALTELAKQAGVRLQEESPQARERAERGDILRGVLQAAADIFHQQLMQNDTALGYARDKRGFTLETIQRFQIGYALPSWQHILDELKQLGYPEEDIIEAGLAIKNDQGQVYDRFRNRLMIPIRDERGRVIGFGARALDPQDSPKYLNSPQTPVFDKSQTLFGLDTAKRTIRDTETAVIVEGYMDAITAQQAGFMNVVAQMGTALTETQIKTLARYAKKLILALDADVAGQNAMRRSLETARQTLQADYAGRLMVDIRILQIPDAKDPDDFIREHPEQWQTVLDSAMPVADFVIDMELATLPADAGLPQREAVARRVLPILTASESNIYTRENVQKLARRLRIAEADLLAWAQEEQARHQKLARPPSTNEPPPLDYDDAMIPPSLEDDDYGLSVAPQPQVLPESSPPHEPERYCLKMLIQYPDMYYQVNRKFRELANGDARLLNGPLSDFNWGDFTRTDYQVIMKLFEMAIQQQDQDVQDYLQSTLDIILHPVLDSLLNWNDTHMITARIKGRFQADLTSALRQYEKQARSVLNDGLELVLKAMELRRNRIRQQLTELYFIQSDLPAQDMLQTSQQVSLLKLAREKLDYEIQQQSKKFS